MSQPLFSSLGLSDALITNLTSLEYHTMTPIQAKSLPDILAGKDVIAQGQTGSGKTAAFGLGILAKLKVERYRIQALVLCPTRELADQVAKEIRKLARTMHNVKVLTLCGGLPFGPQIASLEHGAHIIVGTPGRVEDHLNKQRLDLSNLEILVLDEADRMLEMGFQSALDTVIEHTPAQRQSLLFSATYPTQIKNISQKIMQSPVMHKVESTHNHNSIEQHFYQVETADDRLSALRLLLLAHQPESAIVFCNTKKEVQQVADILNAERFSVMALHGDLEQRDRDGTLVQFANKSVSILVATDVAARGLDIDSLDAVFNYQIAHDIEVHTHRIGRTGRAGEKGLAFTFYHAAQDGYKIALLEDDLDNKITSETLPDSSVLNQIPRQAKMATIIIAAGKKQKIRPGDILGALTNGQEITGQQIGKIALFDTTAFVAVERKMLKSAINKLNQGKLKGKSVKAWALRN